MVIQKWILRNGVKVELNDDSSDYFDDDPYISVGVHGRGGWVVAVDEWLNIAKALKEREPAPAGGSPQGGE